MAEKTKSTQLILALIKLESRRTVKYWGPLSFDLTFMRLKFTSLGIYSLCNRELRFREFVQNSAVPFSPLRRLREWTWLRTCHPPRTLNSPGPETEWNADWQCIGLRTTACGDFVHPWVVWNSNKTEGGGTVAWRSVRSFDIISSKCRSKCHFLMLCMF
jgi:hypothetical protein